MSAFVSFVHQYGAHLFTDRAVWASADQTLLEIRNKATVSRCGRIAVTSKGDVDLGAAIATAICTRADAVGAEAMIDGLQDFADGVADHLGVIGGQRAVDVLVVAYIPGRGGVHRLFRTYAVGHCCAYEVIEPDSNTYWNGAPFVAADIARCGLGRLPSESDPAYVRRLGTGILSAMRTRPGCIEEGGPRNIWVVGGGIDCTSLLHSGARIERLVDWPDVIGERVDPFRGMSRAERRRAERMVA